MKYIPLVILSFLMLACWEFHNTATPQASATIEDSKQKKVFLFELKPSSRYLQIHNKMDDSIDFDEMWIEKAWFYTNERNKFRKSQSNQIVIRLKEDKLDGFCIEWGVGITKSDYGAASGNICIDIGDSINEAYTIKSFNYPETLNSNGSIAIDSIKAVVLKKNIR